jgi:methionyl-tRNA formyltransferase
MTFPIPDEADVEYVYDGLMHLGAKICMSTLEKIVAADGHPASMMQDETPDLKHAPKIFKETCQINWHQPAKSVYDFVRGLSPYPAATMILVGPDDVEHPFKLFQVAFAPDPQAVQGALLSDGKTYLKIGVNGGFISILNLQLGGKKRMPVAEFLRGCNVNGWKLVE